jgi:hypothetical protein
MEIKNKMIKYLIIILGLVGDVLIVSSIILFAFELDSLFGLFIIGVFILLADYIIFDIIS